MVTYNRPQQHLYMTPQVNSTLFLSQVMTAPCTRQRINQGMTDHNLDINQAFSGKVQDGAIQGRKHKRDCRKWSAEGLAPHTKPDTRAHARTRKHTHTQMQTQTHTRHSPSCSWCRPALSPASASSRAQVRPCVEGRHSCGLLCARVSWFPDSPLLPSWAGVVAQPPSQSPGLSPAHC